MHDKLPIMTTIAREQSGDFFMTGERGRGTDQRRNRVRPLLQGDIKSSMKRNSRTSPRASPQTSSSPTGYMRGGGLRDCLPLKGIMTIFCLIFRWRSREKEGDEVKCLSPSYTGEEKKKEKGAKSSRIDTRRAWPGCEIHWRKRRVAFIDSEDVREILVSRDVEGEWLGAAIRTAGVSHRKLNSLTYVNKYE